MSQPIRLTQFSHGAGCGCKIAPAVLARILAAATPEPARDPRLVVGYETADDAAVYDAGNGLGVVSTTDFFMPIVDDPFDFGRIAVTNALSDVYAMGGRPIMAISVLGWPLDRLPEAVAADVVAGGRQACADAGISLAGGHSIDAPEPIFGAAVTGLVPLDQLKRNDGGEAGCTLYLTKPLGIGILTTAEKKGLLAPEHVGIATAWMCRPNTFGIALGALPGVAAMTDVTGFGLLGHLVEMCAGAGLRARISFAAVPRLPGVDGYVAAGAVPGGTERNFASYGERIGPLPPAARALLCDPQTSGGLLVAVRPGADEAFLAAAATEDVAATAIGELLPPDPSGVLVAVDVG